MPKHTPTIASIAGALFTSLALSAPAFAAGSDDHGHGHGGSIGAPGDASDVTTTIDVTMYDNYYEPEEFSVKEGETVRFVITNAGKFVHEFNIATPDMHEAHGPEMKMMLEHGVLKAGRIDWAAAEAMQQSMGHGMHDEPNSVLLEPGESAEMIWTFPAHAELEFACNIPGHYDSGMVGDIMLTH